MELLNTNNLIYLCELLNIPLVKINTKDMFFGKVERGCYIVNLDDSDGSGTHWTCFYVGKKEIAYFDSFGLNIPEDIEIFLSDANKDIMFNIDQIQTFESVACGWYCLYFLYFASVLNSKENDLEYVMNMHNSLYNIDDREGNDKILQRLIKGIVQK